MRRFLFFIIILSTLVAVLWLNVDEARSVVRGVDRSEWFGTVRSISDDFFNQRSIDRGFDIEPETPRLALVIGNSDYSPEAGGRLSNPGKDAETVASALAEVGFSVQLETDLDYKSIRRVIRDHRERIDSFDGEAVSFFYFAGHGANDTEDDFGGTNYIIPIESRVTSPRDLSVEALTLGTVVDAFSSARVNFVVFDACRNFPFETTRIRSQIRGFVPEREVKGAFIAFSSEPGKVAFDNSGYATSLATAIQSPNLDHRDVFNKVRTDVYRQTNERQFSWFRDGVLGDFQFKKTEAESQPTIEEFAQNPVPMPSVEALRSEYTLNDLKRELQRLGFSEAYNEELFGHETIKALRTIERRNKPELSINDVTEPNDDFISKYTASLLDLEREDIHIDYLALLGAPSEFALAKHFTSQAGEPLYKKQSSTTLPSGFWKGFFDRSKIDYDLVPKLHSYSINNIGEADLTSLSQLEKNLLKAGRPSIYVLQGKIVGFRSSRGCSMLSGNCTLYSFNWLDEFPLIPIVDWSGTKFGPKEQDQHYSHIHRQNTYYHKKPSGVYFYTDSGGEYMMYSQVYNLKRCRYSKYSSDSCDWLQPRSDFFILKKDVMDLLLGEDSRTFVVNNNQ